MFESIADELLERIGLTKMNVDYSTYMSLDPVAIRKDYFIDFGVETPITKWEIVTTDTWMERRILDSLSDLSDEHTTFI